MELFQRGVLYVIANELHEVGTNQSVDLLDHPQRRVVVVAVGFGQMQIAGDDANKGGIVRGHRAVSYSFGVAQTQRAISSVGMQETYQPAWRLWGQVSAIELGTIRPQAGAFLSQETSPTEWGRERRGVR
jgi:hypothetical protein